MSRLSTLWRTSLLLFFLFIAFGASAQAPQGINYQAVARDADGNPLADTSLNVTVSLAQDDQLIVTEFIETHVVTTNPYGLFSIVIGEGTPTLNSLDSVTWSSAPIFLNIQIGSLDMGTSALQSVPYALYAQEVAGGLDDGDWEVNDSTVFTNQKVGIGTAEPIADLDVYLTGQSAYGAFTGSGDAFNYSGLILGSIGPTRRWNLLHRSDTATQHGLMFEYYDGTDFHSRMLIDRFGLVGIGTESPSALLDVAGMTETDSLRIASAYTLPSFDGQAGQVLITDGAGNIVWSSVVDSLQSFELIGDTTIRMVDGSGFTYDLDISSLTTDAELQGVVTGIEFTLDSLSQVVAAIMQDSIPLLWDSVQANADSIADVRTDLQNHIADDLDIDPTNELQDLSRVGDSVLISNGQGVDLSDFAYDNQIDSLGQLIDDNADSLVVHRGEMDDLSDSVNVHRTELNALADSIGDHRTDIDNNADSISIHRAELNDLSDSIIVHRTELNALADSIGDHRTDIDNNADSIAIHRAELNDLSDSIIVHRTELNALADSIGDHRVDLDNHADSINLLRSDLNAHVSNDFDLDSTNEMITYGIGVGDTLMIVEGGDTFSIDVSGLSKDDSTRIRSGASIVSFDPVDSSAIIVLDDTVRYQFYDNRIQTESAAVLIGDEAGNNDAQNYPDSVANVAIGYRALRNNGGIHGNVAVGSEALESTTFSGPFNTAVGNQAMKNNFNGQDNTAVGANALKNGSNPNGNVALGKNALVNLTSGNSNVAVGAGAGTSLTNGGGNVFLGPSAGSISTGSNQLFIENSGSSNPLIWGDFQNDSLRVGGTFQVANTGGDLLTYPIADGDSGNVLITDGLGNLSFQSPLINDFDWDTAGGNVVLYDSTAFVGIGTSSPGSRLEVVTADSVNAVFSTNNTGAVQSTAIEAYGNGDGDFSYGVYSIASGSANNRGVYGYAEAPSDTGFASGVEGWAHDSTAFGINYGVYGDADNSTWINRGVVGVIRGNNTLADGAIYGIATGGGGGKSVALYGRSAFPNFGGGTNYGLYTRAAFADTNYAAYFETGAVYVGDSLIIPSGAASGLVLTSDAAGTASWQPAIGDDLGDHVLDSNLNTNGFFLSGDGDPEGIQIDTAGNIGIGVSPDTSYRLRMVGDAFINMDPLTFFTVQSYAGGFEVLDPTPGSHTRLISDNGGPYYRAIIQNQTPENTSEFSSNFYDDSAHVFSTGAIVFDAGGYTTGRMIINNAGNVGIGNAVTPDSLLDVFGGARVQSLNINSAYTFPTSDGNLNDVLVTDGSGTLSFQDVNSLITTDTLPIIAFDDSNQVEVTTNQVEIRFENNVETWLRPNRLDFDDTPSDLFVGTWTTGLNDASGFQRIVGIGSQTLQQHSSGTDIVAVGNRVFDNLASGSSNVGVGAQVGVDMTSGSNNTLLGSEAGLNLGGSNNTYVGARAGASNASSTSGGVKIGYNAGSLDSTDNRLYIDNSNTAAPLIYGEFDNNVLQVGGTFKTSNLSGDTLTYPTADGASGDVLTTDGFGNLTFQTIAVGDNDWDTTGNYVFNLTDSIGIGTNAPSGALDVNGDGVFWDRLGVGTTPLPGTGQLTVTGAERGITTQASIAGKAIGLYTGADNGGVDTAFAIVAAPASYGSAEYSFYGLNGVLFNQNAVGIGTDNPARQLDVVGDAFIDSIWTDSLVIGNGANQFAIAGSPGNNGEVLTYNGGNAVWQPASTGLWDTTGNLLAPIDTGYNIGINTTNSISDFQFGDDVHMWRYLEPGNDSGLIVSHNVGQNLQYTNSSQSSIMVLTENGIQLISIDSQASGTTIDLDNQPHARLSVQPRGVAINSDSPDAALEVQPVEDSLAILVRRHTTSGGVIAFEDPFNNFYVGIKAPDTLKQFYTITLPDTVPTNGQLMMYDAAADRLKWKELNGSTCPSGFSLVNSNFCIETTARTGDNWFAAADTCISNDAKLPSWSEWYKGTQVAGVDWSGTNAWEWIDQASQNNASIVGGGSGATVDDERQTVAADDPISPSNTIQYRCVYHLKN